jgi:hypothetical protein
MRAKAIPAADDHRRELIQKTVLASLNRAKETIARVETGGVVSDWSSPTFATRPRFWKFATAGCRLSQE